MSQTDTTLPVTQGAIIRNEARITFEWPKPVNFTAEAKGKELTIKFDRQASPDFGALLSALYPYVTSAQRKSDGKTIVLSLNKPYKIRTFLSDNIGGIDLLHIDPTLRPASKQADARTLAPLSPSAGSDAAEATATPTATVPMTTPNDSTPTPPDQEQVQKPGAGIKVNVSASEDSAVIRLPFRERVAIAAFIRNNYLWVVLNKPTQLDLSDFDSLPRTVIGAGEILPGKFTVLRVHVEDNIFAAVAQEENSFEWAILLTPVKHAPAAALKVDINTDPPAPPHVFINSLEMGEPVSLQDPVIGDEMIVTPLFKLGEGVAFNRDFVEFTLLTTAEGVVVAKKSDDVSVVPLRNGLRISLPQGATLTPGLPQVEKISSTEALQSSATLFPYERWKISQEVPRRIQVRTLFHTIVESPDVHEANDARLRLAEIYLGEGMAPEAMAMLDGINRTDPVFYRTTKLAAMRGAANFLMYRFGDAARDFSASELNSNKEMDYWRNMLADLQGKEGQYNYIDMDPDYISKYPPLFRQRLAIVAADRSIDTKEYNTALKIFETLRPEKDTLPENSLLTPINNYVNYLMAKISADTGQSQDGAALWGQLAVDFTHPFVQSRAEFSRTIWDMNHDAINKVQLVDRLERLRLGWHGDSLELKVLTMLGDLYYEQKDYINAMRVWDNGVNTFAGTPAALEMSHRMEETFILMFNEGTADSLSPLDALALYYQYKNYAPPGSTGREMIGHLADRLIAIDLLDQAASLLDHQMRFDAEKVQRSQIGAKIATIYMLGHQPKKALQALEDSVYGEIPATLHTLRNRLAAQSLYELGEPDKAWLILGQDDTVDAERIRLNIYWQRKDWPRVITAVESILKARKDVTAPITLDESEYVLQLALAYIFQNDKTQLQYLHDYFGPLMANNPNKPVFEFITASDITPTPTNFDDVIKNLSETRSFVDNYRARIQAAGLDSIVPPNTAKQ